MEELIFFAIIIFFSIIDGIARARKQKKQGQLPDESSPVPEDWEWEDDQVESYDSGPSYEKPYQVRRSPGSAQRTTLPEYTGPYGKDRETRPASPKSSQGMIPADIWQEIAGLARGRQPAPEPDPSPTEIEPIPPRPLGVHPVHRAHAGFGTDPSSRARSAEDGLDPLRRTLSRDASAVRRQLRSHRKSALRRAVILQEVLGPPAATRPERFLE